MRAARPAIATVALVAAVTLTGCTGEDGVRTPEPASPFRPCPVAVAVESAPTPGTTQPMPAVTLPCFTGDRPVKLAALGRPAVINLWASWCEPCRTELPEFQRFADSAGDQVTVLGVITGDTRVGSASAGQDFGISFPAVFDPEESLRRGLGLVGIPITLFVDAHGGLRHVYHQAEPLTRSTLEELTRRYLGVVVR